MKVQLETVTPNFETFEFAVDDENWYETKEDISTNLVWHKSGPVFNWKLHKGQNFLITRSVNKFGVPGPEHKIVVKVY